MIIFYIDLNRALSREITVEISDGDDGACDSKCESVLRATGRRWKLVSRLEVPEAFPTDLRLKVRISPITN